VIQLDMKLSIIILCWNDRKVIEGCLKSIYMHSHSTDFEVIVSDNGSIDESVGFIRENYPQVQVIENRRNLRFAKANNVGIRVARGEYVLILNPDTIIHDDVLDGMVMFADKHPEAGAFGCRVLNADGSYQVSAGPFPSLRGEWIVASYLRWLGYLWGTWAADVYPGWKGETERQVDWITGCFMLVRREVLRQVGGFDEQFFYYYEDTDLCRRIWGAGYPIIYTPEAKITHLKGQSTSVRLPPLTFALDGQITRYRYYYKYYGKAGVRRARRISLVSLAARRVGYGLIQFVKPTESRRSRLQLLRVLFLWNYRVDPVRLIENDEEPDLNIGVEGRVLER
jgi:GT2 family glycosyltransferase